MHAPTCLPSGLLACLPPPCSLLQTRCEANKLLFDQLVKHVGLEQQGGGGATVINHSSVSANPTNMLSSRPQNLVNAASHALAHVSKGKGGVQAGGEHES